VRAFKSLEGRRLGVRGQGSLEAPEEGKNHLILERKVVDTIGPFWYSRIGLLE